MSENATNGDNPLNEIVANLFLGLAVLLPDLVVLS